MVPNERGILGAIWWEPKSETASELMSDAIMGASCMRSLITGTIIFVVAALVLLSGVQAQTAQNSGTAKAIPDLSGIWEALGVVPNSQPILCGEPSCVALLKLPIRSAFGSILEEPQMLPWAEEKFKAARKGLNDSDLLGRDEENPWLSGCMPPGPAWIMFNPFAVLELRQFPDVVLLFSDDDHAVRRIYLDDRRHPEPHATSLMGYSTGRYDGDTLVIDTTGIGDQTWIDFTGHPHSDALHLVERIRRVNQKTLETQVTIDDPRAYKKPWTKKMVRGLAPASTRVGDDVVCSELLKLGTHYSAGSNK